MIAKNIFEEELLKVDILPPNPDELPKTKYDLALVLDESGSVSAANFRTIRDLSIGLVQSLGDEDRIAVFTFGSTVRKHSTFVNKNATLNVLRSMTQNAGNTALYGAITTANNEFISYSSPDAIKILIVLTDGQNNLSPSNPNAAIQTAQSNNIIIYTVGVGSVNTSVLSNIAQSTGGAYYSASNFSQLEGIFDRIQVDLDVFRDSDNDGLSDYHEKKIAAGELKLGNGATFANYSSLSYLNPDSDGDGILDGQELKIERYTIPGKTVFYCYLYSNPCLSDR